ncbi:MAG: hypothetical protein OXG04_18830, partial [Acidobacteria bacterium]|nr:hypothetical protein [Acidobacteriota bacterium]
APYSPSLEQLVAEADRQVARESRKPDRHQSRPEAAPMTPTTPAVRPARPGPGESFGHERRETPHADPYRHRRRSRCRRLLGILRDDPPTPTQPTPVTPPVAPPTTPVVTLTDLALKGPSWFVDDPVLEVGATVELTLDAEYSDGTTDDVTADASWE